MINNLRSKESLSWVLYRMPRLFFSFFRRGGTIIQGPDLSPERGTALVEWSSRFFHEVLLDEASCEPFPLYPWNDQEPTKSTPRLSLHLSPLSPFRQYLFSSGSELAALPGRVFFSSSSSFLPFLVKVPPGLLSFDNGRSGPVGCFLLYSMPLRDYPSPQRKPQFLLPEIFEIPTRPLERIFFPATRRRPLAMRRLMILFYFSCPSSSPFPLPDGWRCRSFLTRCGDRPGCGPDRVFPFFFSDFPFLMALRKRKLEVSATLVLRSLFREVNWPGSGLMTSPVLPLACFPLAHAGGDFFFTEGEVPWPQGWIWFFVFPPLLLFFLRFVQAFGHSNAHLGLTLFFASQKLFFLLILTFSRWQPPLGGSEVEHLVAFSFILVHAGL